MSRPEASEVRVLFWGGLLIAPPSICLLQVLLLLLSLLLGSMNIEIAKLEVMFLSEHIVLGLSDPMCCVYMCIYKHVYIHLFVYMYAVTYVYVQNLAKTALTWPQAMTPSESASYAEARTESRSETSNGPSNSQPKYSGGHTTRQVVH